MCPRSQKNPKYLRLLFSFSSFATRSGTASINLRPFIPGLRETFFYLSIHKYWYQKGILEPPYQWPEVISWSFMFCFRPKASVSHDKLRASTSNQLVSTRNRRARTADMFIMALTYSILFEIHKYQLFTVYLVNFVLN